MWCVCICNFFSFLFFFFFSFHLSKSTVSFFWFSFISSPARQVSAALLPAPQLCWINTGDRGGGSRLFSMKPALKNIIVMQLETQAPLAFLKYFWQLQSQRVFRSNRGWVSSLRRYQHFPCLPPDLILFYWGVSIQLARSRILELRLEAMKTT